MSDRTLNERLSDAMDEILLHAQKKGGISENFFKNVAVKNDVDAKKLELRFKSQMHTDWFAYKITPRNRDTNLGIARARAALRMVGEERNYFLAYHRHNGSIFKVRNQQFVYIGLKDDFDLGEYIHEFIRVKDLMLFRRSWKDVNDEYPALAKMLFSK